MTVASKITPPAPSEASHPAIAAMVEQIRRVPSVRSRRKAWSSMNADNVQQALDNQASSLTRSVRQPDVSRPIRDRDL
jgi:hypothetical protein